MPDYHAPWSVEPALRVPTVWPAAVLARVFEWDAITAQLASHVLIYLLAG